MLVSVSNNVEEKNLLLDYSLSLRSFQVIVLVVSFTTRGILGASRRWVSDAVIRLCDQRPSVLLIFFWLIISIFLCKEEYRLQSRRRGLSFFPSMCYSVVFFISSYSYFILISTTRFELFMM